MCILVVYINVFSDLHILMVSFFTKEKPLDGAPGPKSSLTKGILKDAVSNKSNLAVHGSLLSKSGSYLGILEKSHDQNESLGFHCSFENESTPAEDIDIPCTQPVSQDEILKGMCIVFFKFVTLTSIFVAYVQVRYYFILIILLRILYNIFIRVSSQKTCLNVRTL